MTSDAEANSLFWKAYATSILQLLTSGGATVGPNSRVYIASSNHSAIPGGNGVPQEITNWGIHSLANNLLDANGGVTFNPTAASGGYVQALALYLEAIKPVSRVPSNADTRIFADMNQTPQAANNINAQSMAQLQAAQANVDAADLKVTAALTAAAAKWAVDPNGKGTTPWLSWYPENAPQYVDALANYDNVKGVLILQTDEVYGPGVGQLTQDLKVLTNALNIKLPLNPGCVPPAPILRQTLTPPPPPQRHHGSLPRRHHHGLRLRPPLPHAAQTLHRPRLHHHRLRRRDRRVDADQHEVARPGVLDNHLVDRRARVQGQRPRSRRGERQRRLGHGHLQHRRRGIRLDRHVDFPVRQVGRRDLAHAHRQLCADHDDYSGRVVRPPPLPSPIPFVINLELTYFP